MTDKLTIVSESLQCVIDQWNKMKTSELDEAANDADRFQMMFYEFVDRLQEWVHSLDPMPVDADAARTDSRFSSLFESLPDPLQIPFETELEMILAGVLRQVDGTEQG